MIESESEPPVELMVYGKEKTRSAFGRKKSLTFQSRPILDPSICRLWAALPPSKRDDNFCLSSGKAKNIIS